MVEQKNLEKKFNPKALIYLSPHVSMEEAFGSMEDWILQVGSHRIMLNPINGYWLFYDPAHDSWEFTGCRVGEVIFYLEGDELAIKINSQPPAWDTDNRYKLAEDLYQQHNDKLKKGLIDRKTFQKEITALRFQDHSGTWWQVKEDDGAWLAWNGVAWAVAIPESQKKDSNSPGLSDAFVKIKEEYFSLWRKREEGDLTEKDFQKAVNDLRLQDERGTWWQVRETDGGWLRWDGSNWIEGVPLE